MKLLSRREYNLILRSLDKYELYAELVREFNNERKYFFNDSYNLED